jgi:hypothetical protein
LSRGKAGAPGKVKATSLKLAGHCPGPIDGSRVHRILPLT